MQASQSLQAKATPVTGTRRSDPNHSCHQPYHIMSITLQTPLSLDITIPNTQDNFSRHTSTHLLDITSNVRQLPQLTNLGSITASRPETLLLLPTLADLAALGEQHMAAQ